MKETKSVLYISIFIFFGAILIFLAQRQTVMLSHLEQLKKTGPTSAVYIVNDQIVNMHGGVATISYGRGVTHAVTTTVFGEPVYGDLDGDGTPDAAVMLTQQTGGSGTFFYVSAARWTGSCWVGIGKAVFLGDRIAPQNMRIVDGSLQVNYAERRQKDPFTTQPSVGVTKYLVLRNYSLVQKQ